jgi:hypothetical protein
MPKLTAAAPMLTNGKEVDNSTQLVDGDTLFSPGSPGPVPEVEQASESATVAMDSPFSGRPAQATSEHQAPTDPARQAVLRAQANEGTPVEPIRPVSDGPQAPLPRVTVVESRSSSARRKSSGRHDPVPSDDGPSTDTHSAADLPPQAAPPERKRRTMQSMHKLQPVSATSPAVVPAASGGSSKALIAVIVVCTLLIVAAVVGVFVIKPGPTGLVLIDVPAQGQVIEVSVNGEVVAGVTSWPHLQKVKAGKASVLIKVKGYEPLLETVVVKETGEVAKLTQQFKKNE